MFGLTFDKLVLIAVIAAFLLGPERLPDAAAGLARMLQRVKGFADDAKVRVKDELGPEYDDVDWKKLDPRQYDPRKIVRDAFADVQEPAVEAQVLRPMSPHSPSPGPQPLDIQPPRIPSAGPDDPLTVPDHAPSAARGEA